MNDKVLSIAPIPCINVEEVTVADWFAKIDEEVNELKEAVLAYRGGLDENLTDNTNENILEGLWKYPERHEIAKEAADVITTITSMEERMGITQTPRSLAQHEVNRDNRLRGRLGEW